MIFSKNLSRISGSATATIFAKAKKMEKKGIDVVHLEIGQPDFLPVKEILESTSNSVLSGNTQYSISRGIEPLRREIVKYHDTTVSTQLDPKNEVILTVGGKLGIFGTLWSLINPGDKVLILNPSWVSYADMVISLGGIPEFISVDNMFNFDEDYLRNKIDKNTKAMIVNSPSNPTGAIITSKSLLILYNICAEFNITMLSDEMYSEYTYGVEKHTSLMEIKNWKNYGVVINGFSKTFSMTGFRLGYVLGNEDIINQINKVNQLTASCPVNFTQHAAITALQNIDKMRNVINSLMPHRRALITELLEDLPVEYSPPKGAIYAWIKVPNLENSIEWGGKLLETKGVAVTPGRAFGPAGEGYFRICFATQEENITKGITRIKEFLEVY